MAPLTTLNAGTALRFVVALVGLAALWFGCDLTSAPLLSGGPMNIASNPLGVPLVALGVVSIALVAQRRWVWVWPLAVLVTLATAGVNFWHYLPIEDGAFHALRTGVPNPDTWPAPALFYALALAPVGIALAAITAGTERVAALLVPSAAAAIGFGFALDAFGRALSRSDTGSLVLPIAASIIVGLVALPVRPPVGAAIAGQAALLSVLCLVLWFTYAAPL